ncbi:MAG: tyrosine--tRNA ligase [Veillonellaceae bacterium]|uniref:tyrosine--tRNA ligase n=1 Tax=Anaerovibrio lipolyticus TaxID=82374 RepID=UPI001EEEA867|nr:tyrosine--tRNA ligase [Anaerovibrio lipolyticus]MCI7077531.1 tyrosine--tRNA ligase [Veillonellaceae bacterium]MDY4485445.1 tyrosine--tRNA ligase [Anaerovibrio sp.]MCF2600722.1 tyrosine--tRNA ligase [Anaerovibrio lipolyticus]MCI7090553.1 tyrosine--tRNA ligase [Veillonellaceae bacterium]MCI7266862.1 tyrosine--tRNA ligase [Veillonellaceae bacterium]
MSTSIFDVLKERGYIAQCTNEDEVRKMLANEKVTFYIGFDPTADSLHVGHFLGLMVMAHMQRAGHRPICLVGGGTGTVGDPSGRTDMRKMLTDEDIEYNCNRFKEQMARFIDFSDDKALIVNNGDWLRKLNYIELLRDVGPHFTVNRMLTAECYKNRMEKGLTFLEFNYMIMQSYDFLELHRRYNLKLEMGGDDQWSNIIGGVELTRRKTGDAVYGLTFTLLTKSDGKKMGKTAGGALWLDKEKTPVYDFYQYWRNVDDADVEKCLALLTFLPMEEVHRLGSLQDAAINEAKKVLAYEVTKLVHGQEEADKAQAAAEAVFGGSGSNENMPTIQLTAENEGQKLLDILVGAQVFESKGEGRRLIKQNGLSLNDAKLADPDYVLTDGDFTDGEAIVRKGKKKFYRLVK